MSLDTIRNLMLDVQAMNVNAPYSVQEKMARYWLIGDTHKGHSEIQKHTRRPSNVDSLVEHNWRQLVKPRDIVIHLGDVAFGFVNLKAWIDSLPGTKVLVIGNHDPKSVSWYMRNGFAFACDGIVLGGVYYTHRPSKHLPEGARLNVHGHCHNRWPRGLRYYEHSRLFALEYENYSPRIISKFLSNIEKQEPFYRSRWEWLKSKWRKLF